MSKNNCGESIDEQIQGVASTVASSCCKQMQAQRTRAKLKIWEESMPRESREEVLTGVDFSNAVPSRSQRQPTSF